MILKTQFELLLYTFLIGIYIGVTYDLLYYFIFMHLKKPLKIVFDFIFFICQGFIVFRVIYKINYGIIPFYCYIFICLGFLLYYHYANRYYLNYLFPFRKLLYFILDRIIRILNYLFIKPFKDTFYFLRGIYLYLKKKFTGCVKYVKQKIKKHKKAKEEKLIQNKA